MPLLRYSEKLNKTRLNITTLHTDNCKKSAILAYLPHSFDLQDNKYQVDEISFKVHRKVQAVIQEK